MHSIATTSPSLQGSLPAFLPSAAVPSRRAAPLAALRILANALLIVGLLSLNMTGDYGAMAFFAVLTVMLLVSPEAAFKSLAICYLGLMINTYFVPKSLVWTPSRIILPTLAMVRFGMDLAVHRLSLFNRASYISLLFFGAVMAFCSMISGWYTQIALLKIAYFLTFVTMIWAATAVLRHRRADLGEWFVSLILAAALFGVGAIALGVDNNFRPIKVDVYDTIYGEGFNGAFGHPNAHAVYASLFIAFLACVWLLSLYRHRWLVLPLMACWALFTAWSGSRTAILASAMALLLLIIQAKPMRTRFGWKLRPHLKRSTMIGIGAAVLTVALFYDALTENSLGKSLSSIIVKGTVSAYDVQQQVSLERIVSSRRSLIQYSWQNFLENQATGIGFGVAKTEQFKQMATYLTAPSEKGFLPTAILEEGGLIGTTAFLLFIGLFSRELLRERNVAGLVIFLTFLASNFGEVTIFSPGGAGAFGWIMVAAAMVLSDRCWIRPPVAAAVPPGDPGWRP